VVKYQGLGFGQRPGTRVSTFMFRRLFKMVTFTQTDPNLPDLKQNGTVLVTRQQNRKEFKSQ